VASLNQIIADLGIPERLRSKSSRSKIGANFIVQGAYRRSRWAEMVLGGVTREMLCDSQIPVLISH
jgi:nucleotide-binding universal stress UspA family protein